MAQALPGSHRMDFYHYSWSLSLDGQRIGVANNREPRKTAPLSTRQLGRMSEIDLRGAGRWRRARAGRAPQRRARRRAAPYGDAERRRLDLVRLNSAKEALGQGDRTRVR